MPHGVDKCDVGIAHNLITIEFKRDLTLDLYSRSPPMFHPAIPGCFFRSVTKDSIPGAKSR